MKRHDLGRTGIRVPALAMGAASLGSIYHPVSQDEADATVAAALECELNYFDVGEPLVFRLVDMPGYGFAKAPKDVVRKWRFLVNDYLRGRQVLKRTLVLIDSRHGIKDVDREVLEMLDLAAVSYRLVLTKAEQPA